MSDILKFDSLSSYRDRELSYRAYNTLLDNVYNETGYLWSPYRCISPGKGGFDGIWNWDSAFHAIGVSHWDTVLAKESILGFFKFQKEDGLLPDVIWENNSVVDTFTKPPIFAFATESVYKKDHDLEFLEQMYPKLVLNEKFYTEKRCDNGLYYYDAENKDSEDYLTRVKYESGWDNSVRWDNGITEYYPVDLNCFMVMFFRSLSFIAGELGYNTESEMWSQKAITLSELINTTFWDNEKKFYSDTNRYNKKVSDVLSPASFMPLFIKIASEDQANAMKEIAITKFKSKMPTVSFDNPEYSNDYWRGPTWLNVAYFAAKGLKNYGFSVADDIKESILNMCHNEKRGIFENYDSINETGLCCDHFSWSSVFILEFIFNF